jgi:hypothetical protein
LGDGEGSIMDLSSSESDEDDSSEDEALLNDSDWSEADAIFNDIDTDDLAQDLRAQNELNSAER